MLLLKLNFYLNREMQWDKFSSAKFVNTLTCWRGIITVWLCGILQVPGYLFHFISH